MSFGKFFRAIGMGLKAASKAAAQRKAASTPKRKNVPILTPDMLEPVGKALTRAEAVKLYRAFVSDVARIHPESVGIASVCFGDSIKYIEDDLRTEIEFLTDEYRNAREQADSDMEDVRDEGHDKDTLKLRLAEAEAPAIQAKAALTAAKDRLATFKANRRDYLVAYANNEFHGTPMPAMYITGVTS